MSANAPPPAPYRGSSSERRSWWRGAAGPPLLLLFGFLTLAIFDVRFISSLRSNPEHCRQLTGPASLLNRGYLFALVCGLVAALGFRWTPVVRRGKILLLTISLFAIGMLIRPPTLWMRLRLWSHRTGCDAGDSESCYCQAKAIEADDPEGALRTRVRLCEGARLNGDRFGIEACLWLAEHPRGDEWARACAVIAARGNIKYKCKTEITPTTSQAGSSPLPSTSRAAAASSPPSP
jgi:hypothetical protein